MLYWQLMLPLLLLLLLLVLFTVYKWNVVSFFGGIAFLMCLCMCLRVCVSAYVTNFTQFCDLSKWIQPWSCLNIQLFEITKQMDFCLFLHYFSFLPTQSILLLAYFFLIGITKKMSKMANDRNLKPYFICRFLPSFSSRSSFLLLFSMYGNTFKTTICNEKRV